MVFNPYEKVYIGQVIAHKTDGGMGVLAADAAVYPDKAGSDSGWTPLFGIKVKVTRVERGHSVWLAQES